MKCQYGYGFHNDCHLPLSELTRNVGLIQLDQRQYHKLMEEQDKFSPDHYLDDNYDPEQLSEIESYIGLTRPQ